MNEAVHPFKDGDKVKCVDAADVEQLKPEWRFPDGHLLLGEIYTVRMTCHYAWYPKNHVTGGWRMLKQPAIFLIECRRIDTREGLDNEDPWLARRFRPIEEPSFLQEYIAPPQLTGRKLRV